MLILAQSLTILGICKIVLHEFKLGIVKYHFEIGAGKENYEWV